MSVTEIKRSSNETQWRRVNRAGKMALIEFSESLWDKQIEEDLESGKLDLI
jgi:hypothetical protein